MRRDPLPKGFIPDNPGVDRADFDFDDMTHGTARFVVFFLILVGIGALAGIIGLLTWLKS
jgi:formate hydrogenlyase subunit 3/multisubunit Na+/H+ antiporter MnhD subunit